jgi:NADPH-dependent 2,4-dienoyl-CoA reductase/sulfur reductase-like enzyme
MPTRYLIVGNGPAGATAARTIREHDATAEIQVVGAEKHAFYSRPGLAYYLTGQIPEGALFSRPDKELDRAHVKRTVGRVAAVDPHAHRVELADGKVLRYDRLLLGVGATAVRPDVEGIGLEGVVTLDNLDDARLILRLAKKAKRAVVVGGGITAIELAEGLVANGVTVHYLMRGDRYWASVLDERESALVEGRLEHDGVVLHRNTELGRVLGHKNRMSAVETKDGERLDSDMLAVAVGTQVRLELAKQIGLETGRGIFTDDTLATTEPDIYAAGDAAEALDPATGRRGIDSLWSVAIAQGRVAGVNMAGGSESYMPRPAPFNVTRIGGVTTTLIGAVGAGGRDGDLVALARGDSNAWREQLDGFAVATDSGADHLRLILSEDRILGAVVMGDQSLSRTLLHVVRARLDIREVRDRLLEGQAEVRQALALVMERAAPHAV